MVLARWQATIVDDAGDVQSAASIEVRREVSGAPLANLFSDRDGAVPIGNPFAADSDGFAAFHATGGAYRITATKGAFTRTWRYVGVGLASEYDLTDVDGLAVVQNVEAGYALLFETGITTPPGAGAIRFDDADLSLATEAYVSLENAAGSDITAVLLDLFDAARTRKDRFILTDLGSNTQASFQVDGATTDGSPASYIILSISDHSGETSFAAGPINLQRELAGADGQDGDVPPSRTLTSGGGLTGGGDLSANRTFVVGAGTGITVNADDVAVDKASDANVRASASNKVLTTDLVESAAAYVTLTETSGSVAVDWDTFINGTVTVDQNSAIANPTNGQPGTNRMIYVIGNDATDRTITFGNQFLGEVPTITDCDSGRAYLLTIHCKTASHFVVSAKKALGT